MMDLTLSNGHQITVDLDRISHKDFLAFWKQTATEEQRSDILKKWVGLTSDEIEALPEADWRNLRDALQRVSFMPDSEPPKNSPGASS